MFSSNKITNYLIYFGLATMIAYVANKHRAIFDTTDEYELIKKYLLNDSPLYGFNRPKIWIHSKYEINARNWKDFQSRNTTDLNQPYLHLTIKSIINHCGNDFNICLIDDDTFSKLIPSWDIDLANVAEPMKTHYREIGMLQLIFYYGGLVVPNSTICLTNLKDFYYENIANGSPFVCENINHSVNTFRHKNAATFMPNTFFMGASKNDSTIKEFIEYLKKINRTSHFSNETDFIGNTSEWCMNAIKLNKMDLVSGKYIGVKTNKNAPILLDNLMEEEFLDVSSDAVAIYIPQEEILRRNKYQWFAVMSTDEILSSNIAVSKYLKSSIVDSTDEYYNSTTVPSVVSI